MPAVRPIPTQLRLTALVRVAGAICMLLASAATQRAASFATAPDATSTGHEPEAAVSRVVFAMGTSLRLALRCDAGEATRAEALRASEQAVRALAEVERRLSTWRDDSELAGVHAHPVGSWLEVSAATAADLARAFALERATDGAFTPAVGALVAAYDLRGSGRWPDADERTRLRACTGAPTFTIEGQRIRRNVDGAQLEEGAFAKGAGLAAARDAALAAGASEVWFDFGGQVLLAGDAAAPRRVELADPADRGLPIVALRLTGGCLATTGNGVRRRIVDGRALGHVLDPRTALPAADFGSVTVWCEEPFVADALSTALFVLGADEALRFAERMHGVEAVVVLAAPVTAADRDRATRTVRATSGLRHCIEVIDGRARLPAAHPETNERPRLGAPDF